MDYSAHLEWLSEGLPEGLSSSLRKLWAQVTLRPLSDPEVRRVGEAICDLAVEVRRSLRGEEHH